MHNGKTTHKWSANLWFFLSNPCQTVQMYSPLHKSQWIHKLHAQPSFTVCTSCESFYYVYFLLLFSFQVSLFFPITFLIFCAFLLVMTLYEGAMSSLIGVGICCSAIPLYIVGVAWKNKPKAYFRTMKKVNVFLQKLFICVPEDKEYLDWKGYLIALALSLE